MKNHIAVHSYDIFDTCISRLHAYPRDVFLELGYQLAPKHLSSQSKLRFAKSFQKRRIWAEKIAYFRAKPHHSASLNEIYKNFRPPSGLKFNVTDIMMREVALERESIYPVPQIISEIKQLSAESKRVIFVSDMYLSREFLAEILEKNGLSGINKEIYVSSDSLATKHSGELFAQVLRSESVSGDEIAHIGDNLWADISVPRRLGIATRHFTSAWLTKHEAQIAGQAKNRDLGKSYVAGLSRKLRLTSHPTESSVLTNDVEHLMFGTIAPFLVSFVDWILRDALATGVKRLYFIARDGEVLFKIATRLLGERTDLELRYLHGSRRAWLVPSIMRESNTWKQLLVTAGQENSPFDILVRAGVTDPIAMQIQSALSLSSEYLEEKLSFDEANLFVDRIFDDAAISKIIFDHAASARAIALRYFEQEGLFENTPWAIVDIGWSLNCQSALKRILSTIHGPDFDPIGYYLGVGRNHLNRNEAGIARCYTNEPGSLFSRRRVILEHCFTPSTHATTRSYQADRCGKVHPEFGQELRSEFELCYAQRLHEIAEHAAEVFARDKEVRRIFEAYPETINANVERLIRFPTNQEAALMAHFGTVADLRHEHKFVQPLCGKLGLRDVWSVIMVTLSRKHNFSTPAFMWLEGSTALSPAYVRAPLAIMLKMDAGLNWLRSKWKKKRHP